MGNYNNFNQNYNSSNQIASKCKKEWITVEADKEMISFAEEAGKYMKENSLTTSQIRNIYGEIKRIQMNTYEKKKSDFFLLKPKVAYALGRNKDNKGLQLFKDIFDRLSPFVSDEKSYHNFCNLMEAILAYHKANGGK